MGKIEDLTRNPAADAGRFVDAEERDALAGIPLRIVGMTHDSRNRFGPRWLVSCVVLTNGEKIAIGLADNDARNAMYPAIEATLADDGAEAIEPVVLYRRKPEKGGNAFWDFRTATDDELATVDDDGGDDDDAADDAAADDAAAPVLAKSHRARK